MTTSPSSNPLLFALIKQSQNIEDIGAFLSLKEAALFLGDKEITKCLVNPTAYPLEVSWFERRNIQVISTKDLKSPCAIIVADQKSYRCNICNSNVWQQRVQF